MDHIRVYWAFYHVARILAAHLMTLLPDVHDDLDAAIEALSEAISAVEANRP